MDAFGHPRKPRWWARQDSNLQPDRYERPALTIELQAPAAMRAWRLPRAGRAFKGLEAGVLEGAAQAVGHHPAREGAVALHHGRVDQALAGNGARGPADAARGVGGGAAAQGAR